MSPLLRMADNPVVRPSIDSDDRAESAKAKASAHAASRSRRARPRACPAIVATRRVPRSMEDLVSEEPTREANAAKVVTESDRPVTFRDVFAIGEYRAIYTATQVNWIGDYLAKAAVTLLVYQQSDSVLLSAAAFGVSFLPWIIGGTLLSALAERYPYRRVLISADLFRIVPTSLLLVPHIPIWIMVVLVFLASLGVPPTQSARSALLPHLVGREKLPTAIAINQTTTQAAQVFGYMVGATIATALSPRLALGIDVL